MMWFFREFISLSLSSMLYLETALNVFWWVPGNQDVPKHIFLFWSTMENDLYSIWKSLKQRGWKHWYTPNHPVIIDKRIMITKMLVSYPKLSYFPRNTTKLRSGQKPFFIFFLIKKVINHGTNFISKVPALKIQRNVIVEWASPKKKKKFLVKNFWY